MAEALRRGCGCGGPGLERSRAAGPVPVDLKRVEGCWAGQAVCAGEVRLAFSAALFAVLHWRVLQRGR